MDKPLASQHMIVFWLGVLTGALIVAIIFLYGTINVQEIKDAMLLQGR